MFPEVDLRDHKMSCADATTRAFGQLAVKDGYVFVADHDPAALRYMFEAERAGQFAWGPLAENANGIWRVQVRCVAAAPAPGRGELSVTYGRRSVSGTGTLPERMTAHHG